MRVYFAVKAEQFFSGTKPWPQGVEEGPRVAVGRGRSYVVKDGGQSGPVDIFEGMWVIRPGRNAPCEVVTQEEMPNCITMRPEVDWAPLAKILAEGGPERLKQHVLQCSATQRESERA